MRQPQTLLSILLLNMLCLINLHSQESYIKTVVPGNSWTIRIGNGSHFPDRNYQVLITCDTVHLDSLVYHAVEVAGNECGPGGYVREDTLEQSVYFINRFDEENWKEALVADYSLEIGDTFEFDNGWRKQVVKDVRIVNFFGDTSRFIDFGVSVNDGFVEGHGRISTGILNECNAPAYPRLRGFERIDLACDAITNLSSVSTSYQIKIGPNPVRDHLYIDIQGAWSATVPVSYSMVTMIGEPVQTGILDQEGKISLGHLPSGIFLLVLNLNDKQIVRKIIHARE